MKHGKKLAALAILALLTLTVLPTTAMAEQGPDAVHGKGLIAPTVVPVMPDAPSSQINSPLLGSEPHSTYGFTMENDILVVQNQTPVRNQGQNGTCWAFSAMAAVEANLLHNSAGGELPDLSEAHMIYSLRKFGTSQTDVCNDDQGVNGDPALGGNSDYAAAYLMRGTTLGGTLAEETDPYTYIDSPIPYRSIEVTKQLGENKAYTVENIRHVTANKAAVYDGENEAALREMAAIKQAVYDCGAVSTSMYWDDKTPTNYNSDTGAYYATEGSEVNHAVTIVGWDDSYDAGNFTQTPPKNGAWLIKNSWGVGYGIGVGGSGYYWVSYCDPTIGEMSYAIDGVHEYSSRETVHEYDYRIDCHTNNNWSYLAAFPCEAGMERLDAVKVFLNTAAEFTISVCTDYTPGTAEQLAAQSFVDVRTVTVDTPGCYTFRLNEPLVTEGDFFAVCVSLTSADMALYGYLPSEMPKLTHKGEEYDALFCTSGSQKTWRALGHYENDSFVPCIKAVTTDLSGGSAEIASVERSGEGLLVSVDTDMAGTVLLAAASYRDGRMASVVLQEITLKAIRESFPLAFTWDADADCAVFLLDRAALIPLSAKWEQPSG